MANEISGISTASQKQSLIASITRMILSAGRVDVTEQPGYLDVPDVYNWGMGRQYSGVDTITLRLVPPDPIAVERETARRQVEAVRSGLFAGGYCSVADIRAVLDVEEPKPPVCPKKYFPRDHGDNLCACGRKVNDHLCLCGCERKCSVAPLVAHCQICGDRLEIGQLHQCSFSEDRPWTITHVAGQKLPEPVALKSGDRLMMRVSVTEKKASIAGIWVEHAEGDKCPDCYVGLAGQIEPCERHR